MRRSKLSWKAEAPITRGQLRSQRDEFWDTQPSYSGRQEIWMALRLACEAATQEDAQAIIDSANITIPTGNLTEGCYDELGNHYVIPIFCIVEPTNLIRDNQPSADLEPQSLGNFEGPSSSRETVMPSANSPTKKEPFDLMVQIPPSSPSSSSQPSPLQQTSPTASSSPTSASSTAPKINLVFRLSTAKDIKLSVSTDDTIGTIVKAIEEAEGYNTGEDASKVKLRLFFLGRQLEYVMRIKDTKVAPNSVVQVMVSPLS
ncbi:hypothetical protein HK102_004853 [Quaeritorhiza haematococci]|nr:hypothetical protein HK102_004853 [Quaeritorhiza haematococci]